MFSSIPGANKTDVSSSLVTSGAVTLLFIAEVNLSPLSKNVLSLSVSADNFSSRGKSVSGAESSTGSLYFLILTTYGILWGAAVTIDSSSTSIPVSAISSGWRYNLIAENGKIVYAAFTSYSLALGYNSSICFSSWRLSSSLFCLSLIFFIKKDKSSLAVNGSLDWNSFNSSKILSFLANKLSEDECLLLFSFCKSFSTSINSLK